MTRFDFDRLSPEARASARLHALGDAWEGDDPADQPAADPARYAPARPGCDPLGRAIPPELRDLFVADFLFDVARQLDRTFVALNGAKSWLHYLKPEGLGAIKDAARYVRDAIPFCVCQKCKGVGCAACATAGYLPEWKYLSDQGPKKAG